MAVAGLIIALDAVRFTHNRKEVNMRRFMVQVWRLRFILCTLFPIFLVACGKGGDASKALSVNLAIPADYTEANFWLGVTQKKLIVEPKSGDKHELAWGNAADMDLHKGDHLRFEGSGPSGDLLVFGEADVGDENTVSIPVQRAL